MPANLSKGLLVFALLVIAVLSWQWMDERTVTQAPENQTVEMAEKQSDYYLEDFEIINVSNEPATEDTQTITGRHLRITGESLSHHYLQGYSTLIKPKVQMRSGDNQYWLASADSGTVSAGFDVLDLEGDVQLIHDRADSGEPIAVDTDSISIDTSQRTIHSDVSVVVTGKGWHYKANSMRAEVDNGTLTFTDGVEAQFESPN